MHNQMIVSWHSRPEFMWLRVTRYSLPAKHLHFRAFPNCCIGLWDSMSISGTSFPTKLIGLRKSHYYMHRAELVKAYLGFKRCAIASILSYSEYSRKKEQNFNRFLRILRSHLLCWNFNQEQPLLLEDLLEQEKREQERQAASSLGNDMDQINIYNVVITSSQFARIHVNRN